MPDDDKLLIDQFSSEYKILQEKIDKIGGFKFTIRGWSVTLVLASVFAVSSTELLSPFLLLLLVVFVWLFFFLERKQSEFSLLFGERAIQIEKDLHRTIRNNLPPESPLRSVGMVPRIAHLVIEARQRRRPASWIVALWRWIKDVENLWYVVQTIVIIAVVLSLSHARSKPRSESSTVPTTAIGYQDARGHTAEEHDNRRANDNGKQGDAQTEGR